MKIISCPWCDRQLPDTKPPQVCANCGKTLHSAAPTTSTIAQTSETSEQDLDVSVNDSQRKTQFHKVLLTLPHLLPLRKGISLPRWRGNHQFQKREHGRFAERTAFSIPLIVDPLDEVEYTDTLRGSTSEENNISQLRPDGQRTWKKVVEPSPHRKSYTYPPRPPVPEGEHMGMSADVSATHLSSSSSTLQAFKRSTVLRMKQTSPRVMFWISTILLLLCGSLFGITNTFGHRQVSPTNKDTRLSLQITPNELSFGATMNLRGENFTPHASVGFRRDNAIPLTNTSGALSTQADVTGHFTDTIIVGNDWGTGPHVITAEDSLTHKVASFPISVSGQGIVSRPPHLRLSVDTLDFGSGDQATNGTKSLMLLNSESSEISWQGSPSESWLLITPNEGNFTHDVPQRVTVAIDRSKLQPGTHSANVHFSSNGGDESLTVSMEVIPLQPEHRAVMHISPAVLSFTAADGSNPTSSQTITISNSGGQAMNWSASADVPWLSVSQPAMAVAPGAFTIAQVSVASRNLLPGTYTGTLTFTAKNEVGDGIVFDSPQRVVVSITVMPPCTLLADPAMLDFSSAYLQPAPSARKVNITVSSGCHQAPFHWNASSNASWLKLNNTDGRTPGTLSIGIDPNGLTPNTYAGAVTVSSRTSTQTILVRFRLSASSTSALPVTSPALVATPASVSISAPGETSAPITLANTGGSSLHWSAKLQSDAPDFVSLSKTSGSNLARGAKTSFNVVVKANKAASGGYQTSVKITATSTANGQSVTDSPIIIPVTITISSPLMQVSNKDLSFSAYTVNTVKTQSLTITNGGGGTLSWTVSPPKQPWLSVSPTKGNTPAGSRSTLTFSAETDGLDARSTAYTDQVVITPSTGSPVTVKVSLLITNSS